MINNLIILYYYLKYKWFYNFNNESDIHKLQKKRIRKHLHYICQNSPYYSSYKGKELSDFPVMDKCLMMESFSQLNTVDMDEKKAMDFALRGEKNRQFSEKLNHISVGLSSGTSGNRGIFLVSNHEKNLWAGYMLAKLLPHGILGSYKIAFFMRANSNLYEAVSSKKINFVFFDIYKNMSEHMNALNDMSPNILIGQPSVLLDLVAAHKCGKLMIDPEKIISIAEVLEEQDEQIIREEFKVPMVHQVYQCTEGCLAITCKDGGFHINEDIIYMEKEYVGENRFIPIITDFTRTSQPIIRYRLNDILVEEKSKCICGSPFLKLKKIEGREDDIFVFWDEKNNMIKVFPDFIRRCILFAGEISNYRVVQSVDSTITVYADVSSDLKKLVIQEFEKLAGDQGFILPKIRFAEYHFDQSLKLKRVEHL